MAKLQSGKPGMLKEINRNLIVKLIIRNGSISRSELSKLTGLALPSIMRLVDGLIEDHLVIDIGKGESTGGRKPKLLTMSQSSYYIIGVEIAIETTIILTDLSGEVIDLWESSEMQESTPEEILEKIYCMIQSLIKKHKISDKLLGIGFGTPGTNFKYRRQIKHTLLKGWERIDVQAWFEERLSFDIFVDNVARTRTLSELWFGYGKVHNDFIYAFIDQGVGCGIVKNGQIIKGANGVAGEFGHTTIEFNGKACYCGKLGCLEMYVSAGSLTTAVNEAGFDYTSFHDVIDHLNNKSSDILKERCHILAAGLGNLINLFNPSVIILGGTVSTSSKEIVDYTRSFIQENIFSYHADQTEIKTSIIDQKALGSIALVMNNKFTSPDLI